MAVLCVKAVPVEPYRDPTKEVTAFQHAARTQVVKSTTYEDGAHPGQDRRDTERIVYEDVPPGRRFDTARSASAVTPHRGRCGQVAERVCPACDTSRDPLRDIQPQ